MAVGGAVCIAVRNVPRDLGDDNAPGSNYQDVVSLANIHNPSTWAEFGLIGLLFGAFVSLLFIFIRTGVKKDVRHQEFVTRLIEDERGERSSMTDRFSKSTDRLSDVIADLSKEISESNRREANQPKNIGEVKHG